MRIGRDGFGTVVLAWRREGWLWWREFNIYGVRGFRCWLMVFGYFTVEEVGLFFSEEKEGVGWRVVKILSSCLKRE